MKFASCLPISLIFSYLRVEPRSVVATAIPHGSLNATAGSVILK
jgi:membrane protease YdiL (CAAX protease family)